MGGGEAGEGVVAAEAIGLLLVLTKGGEAGQAALRAVAGGEGVGVG